MAILERQMFQPLADLLAEHLGLFWRGEVMARGAQRCLFYDFASRQEVKRRQEIGLGQSAQDLARIGGLTGFGTPAFFLVLFASCGLSLSLRPGFSRLLRLALVLFVAGAQCLVFFIVKVVAA